jgi:hypothetical protein
VRAHYRSSAQDATGALLAGAAVAVYENGTTTLLGAPIYANGQDSTTLPNPFITPDGNISIYLDSPQRVDLGVTPPASGQEIWPDIDVLVAASSSVDLTFPGSGDDSTAVGMGSSATATNAVALGDSASATGNDATAVGQGAEAEASGSTAFGQSATAEASATAVGMEATAAGTQSVAVGQDASATGNGAVALGQNAQASGAQGIAIGQGAAAPLAGSAAIGAGAAATAANQIAIGTAGDTVVVAGTLVAPGGIAFYNDVFGNGQGGAVTLDGTTTWPGFTLSGGAYTYTPAGVLAPPSSLTVESGVTLFCAGLPLQVLGALINHGNILNPGGNGSGLSPGTLAGNLIYAAYAGTPAGSGAGGASLSGPSIGMGAGGNGGASPAGGMGSGGAGGVPQLSGAVLLPTPQQAVAGLVVASGALSVLGGGAPGGPGAGDGTDPGGGPGSGGGVLVICAKSIYNDGMISVPGGQGATPITGECGGGGGGGGGALFLFALTVPQGSGVIAAPGGLGGHGSGTGSAGSAGTSGQVSQLLVA